MGQRQLGQRHEPRSHNAKQQADPNAKRIRTAACGHIKKVEGSSSVNAPTRKDSLTQQCFLARSSDCVSRTDRMLFQLFDRCELQCRHVTRSQIYGWSNTCIVRFLPSCSTQAPPIPWHQSGKLVHRVRGRQVIPAALTELKKLSGDLHAHDVQTSILCTGITATVSIEPSHWVSPTND